MNLLEQRRAERRALYRKYGRIKRERNRARGLTSGGKPRKRSGPSMTYWAAAQRKYRRERLHEGLSAMWMLGYDGPEPQPSSAWPRISDYAMKFTV